MLAGNMFYWEWTTKQADHMHDIDSNVGGRLACLVPVHRLKDTPGTQCASMTLQA